MSKRTIFGAAVIAAGLVAGTATVASAHVVIDPPTPGPVSTYPSTYHQPAPRAALWQFDFAGVQTDGLSLNNVRGVGALTFNRWQERDLSPTVSKFFRPPFPGTNSVTLRHNRLPLPDFNLQTCTATFDQVGRFRIIAGTGIGANLRVVPGTSRYILRGLVSFDRVQLRNYRGAVCPLQFVSPGTLRSNIEHNNLALLGHLATLVDFDVQGNARLVRTIPTPYPTGPGHFFAPSVTPADVTPLPAES